MMAEEKAKTDGRKFRIEELSDLRNMHLEHEESSNDGSENEEEHKKQKSEAQERRGSVSRLQQEAG